MSTLLQSFEKFIKKEQLFEPTDQLLVAVSGGVDSIVLVHLLKTIGFSPALAHCNFQLRGNDSDEDAHFVEAFAKTNDLEIHLKNFDTEQYAIDQQVSTQVAARDLRYTWFKELLSAHNYKFLFTAHHSNDQAETMLYNLSKGTGIAGLRGIPLRNEQTIRPLLFATREEIETYAEANKLQWREDASNRQDKYSRNHLRINVIPELKKINPGFEKTMLQNNKRFEALEKLLLNDTAKIKAQYLIQSQDNYSLALDWYNEARGSFAILTELLKPFGFNLDQCISIEEAISTKSVGSQFYTTKYVLTIDREQLLISPNQPSDSFSILIKSEDTLISTPHADFSIEIVDHLDDWPKDKNIACLDADLVRFPLTIRNWMQGDSFHPLGMRGKKKLSDFMIDEKIPVNLKLRLVLFESADEIIWVAGHRIDDRYKITPKTARILIIKMTDHV